MSPPTPVQLTAWNRGELIPGLQHLRQLTLGDPRIRVAILDSEIDAAHPLLQHQALPAARMPAEHGTHIASVIAGQGDASGHHYTGIAPRVTLLSIPIYRTDASGNPVPCSQQILADAIHQACDQHAQVINISGGELSFRTPSKTGVVARAVTRAQQENRLIVAATGNDGKAVIHTPACLPEVLAIGAADWNGRPLPFSNFGTLYRHNAVLAPGLDIPGASLGQGLQCRTGTSFATPLASAVIALLLSRMLQQGQMANPHYIRELILRTAAPALPQEKLSTERVLVGRIHFERLFQVFEQEQAHLIHKESSMSDTTYSAQPGEGAVTSSATEASAMASTAAATCPSAAAPAPAQLNTANVNAATMPPGMVPVMVAPQATMMPQQAMMPAPAMVAAPAGQMAAMAPAMHPAINPAAVNMAGHYAGYGAVNHSAINHGAINNSTVDNRAINHGALGHPGAAGNHAVTHAANGVTGMHPVYPAGFNEAGNTTTAHPPAPQMPHAFSVTASEDSAVAGSPRNPGQLVNCLGSLGFDFEIESRQDYFIQRLQPYTDEANIDLTLVRYLVENQMWQEAELLTWVVKIDSTPCYALRPTGADKKDLLKLLATCLYYQQPQANRKDQPEDRFKTSYQQEVEAEYGSNFCPESLRGKDPVKYLLYMEDKARLSRAFSENMTIDKISFCGEITGETKLYNGTVVPLVSITLSGVMPWDTSRIIARNVQGLSQERKDKIQEDIQQALEKLYAECKNDGVSDDDRALNYAGTNILTIQDIFEDVYKINGNSNCESQEPAVKYELDTLYVEDSKVQRPTSILKDVVVRFFEPGNLDRAHLCYRFTIDVSDVYPVLVEGKPKRYFESSSRNRD